MIENPIPTIIDKAIVTMSGKLVLRIILNIEKIICNTGAAIISKSEMITRSIIILIMLINTTNVKK